MIAGAPLSVVIPGHARDKAECIAVSKNRCRPGKQAERAQTGTNNHRISFCEGWSDSQL
jgi:hypothetical protein